MLGRALDLLYPFLYGEQGGFAGVFDYGNNYAIEQFAAPLDNICVTEGNGVKAAWIDCNHLFGPRGGEGRGGEGRGRRGEGETGEGRGGDVENLPFFLFPSDCQLPTVNCPLPTVNCQLPTAHCQLSTVNCQLSSTF